MNFGLTALIREQGYQCLILFGAGIAFMIVWQLCSLVVNKIRFRTWIRVSMELVFWMLAAFMVSEFLYYGTYGEISLHAIAAFAMGVLLWRKFFYDIIAKWRDNRVQGVNESHGKEK